MGKIFGIFDERPLIWFHYVLLIGIIYGFFIYAGTYLPMKTVIFLFIAVSIGDQLIHYMLGVD